MENKTFTHILQKGNIAYIFSSKGCKEKDIDELKSLIKGIASDEREYNQMLKRRNGKNV
jgi:hypothetical protein